MVKILDSSLIIIFTVLRLGVIDEEYKTKPSMQLVEAVWTVVQFALDERNRFWAMFSRGLDKERRYQMLKMI
jgi:hypothetical protein